MAKKCLHILLLAVALVIPGCVIDLGPSLGRGTGMVLTVRCDNPLLTKADPIEKDGEQRFNENLITSVDFLFYPGDNPAADAPAVHHIRETLSEDPMTAGHWEASFTVVLKQDIVDLIFTTGDASSPNHNKATVYALVNFEEGEVFSSLSETSHAALAAKIITTDFAQTETDFIQPHFKMDGQAVVTYDGSAVPSVDGEINVKRFASKLSVAVHVENSVTLHHLAPEQGEAEPDEVWTPVLHTMRLYLVDGVKTVQLSHDGTTLPDPASEDVETASHKPGYFSYKDDTHRRPFLREDDTEYLPSETITIGTAPNEVTRKYYNTWPMYSYPRHWSDARQNYEQTDYSQGLPAEQPYLKLEMDWRREADTHYSYDRRKYYYKFYIPFNDFTRNRWYAFYLDIGILGSETDEGKAFLDPTYCYLPDWQNKSSVIDRHAEITKARYLSVEKQKWELHNITSLEVPFISSHNVDFVTGSVKATRPYYGDITDPEHPVGSYHSQMHAWIRLNDGANYINTYRRGSYYLDYVYKPGDPERPAADTAYNPEKWLRNTSTTIELNHNLQNNYTQDGFDYSPYTIEFDIVHSDLKDDPTTYTFSQYVRHITIVQYPGIYIEATAIATPR
ncbi:MAG: hypothetical protein K6G79_04690 [Bacteroidales bacterium]|nr:hypothetical protein [Bacteroidales bacterium]